MPFSNSPQYSTYKTVPLKFDGTAFYRSGNIAIQRDMNMINMFYDRVSKENQEREMAIKKRAGLLASAYSLTKVSPTDPVRGSFYDVDQNAFYWVVLNKLYTLKPDVSPTPTLVQTINTSTGYCGFCSYLKSDNTRFVCVSDGVDLWLHNYVAATCTRVTDVDFPTPHQPYPIYLDGYVFLIKSNTGDIYNSDLDDPFSWTPGDFISAEISSDYALRMVKAKNYLVVLGYNSIEYFYDGANVSGSPLSRNDSPFRGCGLISGLCTIGDTTYFVGQDNLQNLAVYSLNSFKVERISNEVVDRTLQTIGSANDEKSQVILNKDGFCISVDGHTFYALVSGETTWLYDVDEKFWYEWRGSDNTGLKIEGVWQMFNGSSYVAITGQSNISILSSAVYQDFGVNFSMTYTTDNFNADTFHRKTCWRLAIFADQEGTGTSNMNVSWSDDDWVTTASTRQVNLFTENSFIKNLGWFRARSWRFSYTDNYPLRMTQVELDLNVGAN